MLFINKFKTKMKKATLESGLAAQAKPAQYKKRSEGVIAIPRRAPYQAREAVCQDGSFSDPRILPDFRVESPVYAAAAQAICDGAPKIMQNFA